MALRKIVEQGDECLTKVCRPVVKFDRRLHDLLDDMAETLADANGAGLAAPQVGILRRVSRGWPKDSSCWLVCWSALDHSCTRSVTAAVRRHWNGWPGRA